MVAMTSLALVVALSMLDARRGGSPCTSTSAMRSVRQVQESVVFRRALVFLANARRRGDPLSQEEIRYFCDRLQVQQVTFPDSLTLVYVPALENLQISYLVFGVTRNDVHLLTPVRDDALVSGIDPAQWNRFAEAAHISKLAEPYQARALACLVYSLHTGTFPSVACENADPSATIREGQDWRVTEGTALVRLRDDGTLVSVTNQP